MDDEVRDQVRTNKGLTLIKKLAIQDHRLNYLGCASNNNGALFSFTYQVINFYIFTTLKFGFLLYNICIFCSTSFLAVDAFINKSASETLNHFNNSKTTTRKTHLFYRSDIFAISDLRKSSAIDII